MASMHTCFRMPVTRAAYCQKYRFQLGAGLLTARSTQFALKCLSKAKIKLRTRMGKDVEESIALRKDSIEN